MRFKDSEGLQGCNFQGSGLIGFKGYSRVARVSQEGNFSPPSRLGLVRSFPAKLPAPNTESPTPTVHV